MQGGTAIASGADMNDYTTPGNYYCDSNPNTSAWQGYVYFSDDAALLSQTATFIDGKISENGTITLEEGNDNDFYQLAVFRAPYGTGYNAVLLTGYDPGTDARYKYTMLDDGSGVEITVSGTSFIIKNKTNNYMIVKVYTLLGKTPKII